MILRFLFWNLHRGSGSQLFASIARLSGLGVDVFLFAETPADPTPILSSLNQSASDPYYEVPANGVRVRFYSSLTGASWTERFTSQLNNRISVQEMCLGNYPGLLIVGAHLDSPVNLGLSGRAALARDLAADIRLLEQDVGHQRTILVGDLNMNPFDPGVVEADALHAVMTRELACSVQNMEARSKYPPFYNPTWSCLGDLHLRRSNLASINTRPPGTFFYSNTGDPTTHFWQLYDQVLVRPELIDRLAHVEILASDGEVDLVTKEGRPRTAAISDHLPILFELDL